jgi:DNA invertase Pin-like site-specific DNA recombinase
VNVVIYTRVSTQEQGHSRNGLEAQIKACRDYINRQGYTEALHSEEIASGGLGIEDRPGLKRAIAYCLRHGHTLLVAKLDRLSRSVALVSSLMDSRLRFETVEDGPDCAPIMLHMKAMIGEHERKLISERTRAALAAKRARGEPLGSACHKDKTTVTRAGALGRAVVASKAVTYAQQIGPMLDALSRSGMTYKQIAQHLNNQGVTRPLGGKWGAPAVCETLKRARRG